MTIKQDLKTVQKEFKELVSLLSVKVVLKT
jgi:hypothetical protein